MIIQAKYDQHREKMLKLAQAMNGTRSVRVLIDGMSVNEDSVNKKILHEPLSDIESAQSTIIPGMTSQNGSESYYRFV